MPEIRRNGNKSTFRQNIGNFHHVMRAHHSMIRQIHNQLDHHVKHNTINLTQSVIHTKSHHFQKAQLFTHLNMKDDLLASWEER